MSVNNLVPMGQTIDTTLGQDIDEAADQMTR